MIVRNNGKYGVVIAYDSENPARAIIVSEPEAIMLRDLLIAEFPDQRPLSDAEKAYFSACREIEQRAAERQRKELRERIATAIYAGMHSNPDAFASATSAIRAADALIAALDKE